MLLPFVAAIIFCGIYPKPMLDRIQPSVKALIAHVEEHSTGYTAARAGGAASTHEPR